MAAEAPRIPAAEEPKAEEPAAIVEYEQGEPSADQK